MRVRILLMGFGNVGKGFCRLLSEKSKFIEKHWGLEPEVVGICTRTMGVIYDPVGLDMERILSENGGNDLFEKADSSVYESPYDAVSGGHYDVLAECTVTSADGRGPALEYMRNALSRGKSVITTNKGPIAFFFRELNELACRTGAKLLFGGTVMSGTPIFDATVGGLAGSNISCFEGVLNGTSNYMLDLMQEGLDYDSALGKAREMGFAEADPSMDIEGLDTALKAMILSQVLWKAGVPGPGNLNIRGISHLDRDLFRVANEKHERVRLLARGERTNGECIISVKPASLLPCHPLYNLPGVLNGLVISTDTIGPVCLIGAGAGARATGFALLHDLLSLYITVEHLPERSIM